MKTILIILASLFSFLSFAQNPPILWQKNIGGSGNEGLGRFEIPNSTDYFLIGDSDSDISGDKTENSRGFNDIWILRLDVNHNILWNKTIGGDGLDIPSSILIYNNKLYILSKSNSSISGEKLIAPFTPGGFDLWLKCLDLNGNLLWQELYGGTENEENGRIIILPNSNLLIGSNSRSSISGNKTDSNIGQNDFWFLEINANNGAIINQKTIGSNLIDNISQVIITPSNNILTIGMSETGISGDKTDTGFGSDDIWLVEMDLSFNILNNKCFGGSSLESFYGGYISLINDYYYLMTYSSSPISGNKTAPYFGSWDSSDRPDYWLIKMDTNFNIIWDKTYGGLSDDEGSGILSLSNTRLLLSGSSSSGPGGNKTSPVYGGKDAWYIIIDTSGFIITQETYGGSNDDYLSPINTTTLGVLYINGISNSGISGNKTVPTNGGYDAWLMEIDASGFLNTESIEGVQTTVSVYPNPSEGIVNVKFNDLEENVVITFYTVDGKILHKENIATNSILKEFDLTEESQMVFYSIVGEKINHSGRIVLK